MVAPPTSDAITSYIHSLATTPPPPTALNLTPPPLSTSMISQYLTVVGSTRLPHPPDPKPAISQKHYLAGCCKETYPKIHKTILLLKSGRTSCASCILLQKLPNNPTTCLLSGTRSLDVYCSTCADRAAPLEVNNLGVHFLHGQINY